MFWFVSVYGQLVLSVSFKMFLHLSNVAILCSGAGLLLTVFSIPQTAWWKNQKIKGAFKDLSIFVNCESLVLFSFFQFSYMILISHFYMLVSCYQDQLICSKMFWFVSVYCQLVLSVYFKMFLYLSCSHSMLWCWVIAHCVEYCSASLVIKSENKRCF